MIISFYAALLAFIYVYLSINVVKVRKANQISLGTDNNENLLRATRAHGNFIEYVPFALILIFLVEYQGTSSYYIHALGVLFVIGRICHLTAIQQGTFQLRVVGMLSTFATLAISAGILLVSSFIQ
ncbi:MAPEG family protein [Pseudoalteromonas sp. MMG010]|uniref:MAPEG family protein n=1 Tax=Pseudoalteromonas sp. MMG010 TaxID=2822685 RepID=UPI001B39E3B8|nr:MAPEG family protein [Pseudoalteromonas sp. MMG010]MBQ4832431.1 MAPEG family protein [Pseudoalteromonas sp. MMG010]